MDLVTLIGRNDEADHRNSTNGYERMGPMANRIFVLLDRLLHHARVFKSKPGGKKPFFENIFIPPMGGMNAGPAVQRTGKFT